MKNFKLSLRVAISIALFTCSLIYANAYVPLPPTRIESMSLVESSKTLSTSMNDYAIYVPASKSTVYITVEDQSGNVVYTTEVASSTGTNLYIDTTGWESGTYTVTETNSKGSVLYDTIIMIP